MLNSKETKELVLMIEEAIDKADEENGLILGMRCELGTFDSENDLNISFRARAIEAFVIDLISNIGSLNTEDSVRLQKIIREYVTAHPEGSQNKNK